MQPSPSPHRLPPRTVRRLVSVMTHELLGCRMYKEDKIPIVVTVHNEHDESLVKEFTPWIEELFRHGIKIETKMGEYIPWYL